MRVANCLNILVALTDSGLYRSTRGHTLQHHMYSKKAINNDPKSLSGQLSPKR